MLCCFFVAELGLRPNTRLRSHPPLRRRLSAHTKTHYPNRRTALGSGTRSAVPDNRAARLAGVATIPYSGGGAGAFSLRRRLARRRLRVVAKFIHSCYSSRMVHGFFPAWNRACLGDAAVRLFRQSGAKRPRLSLE